MSQPTISNMDSSSILHPDGNQIDIDQLFNHPDDLFTQILDVQAKEIAEVAIQLKEGQIILLDLENDEGLLWLKVGIFDPSLERYENILELSRILYTSKRKEVADLMRTDPMAAAFFRSLEKLKDIDFKATIPVLCKETFKEDGAWFVKGKAAFIRKPEDVPIVKPKTLSKKSQVIKEVELEQELVGWLSAKGFVAERQVTSGKNRFDIWIPGECFLELKRGKVTGDDVCQAIDYCANTKKPVVLVGDHINEMASRGIGAFNRAVEADMLCFVQWGAIRTYLKGLLN